MRSASRDVPATVATTPERFLPPMSRAEPRPRDSKTRRRATSPPKSERSTTSMPQADIDRGSAR